jgi:molybdate/tungstate transport system substrate-binding protein
MELGVGWSRRRVVQRGVSLIAGGAVAGPAMRLLAEPLAVLDVASAGSVKALLDGPLKAAAVALGLELHSHAQGADAVARMLIDGSLKADLFLPITAGPMRSVMQAGKVGIAYPIARTEMVLLYSRKSRFAARFDAAATGKESWWEILREPGVRFARGSPAGDPGGRNAFFVMMLAAKKYGHTEMVERLLGPVVNPPTQAGGGNNQEKLETGELDAATSYRVATSFGDMPYLVLPKDVNLSGDDVAAKHPEVKLMIEGKTFVPEPLVFYAGVLKDAANGQGAAAFVEWLRGDVGQGLLRKYQYNDPVGAEVLRA